MFTGIVQWMFTGKVQRMLTCLSSGVLFALTVRDHDH